MHVFYEIRSAEAVRALKCWRQTVCLPPITLLTADIYRQTAVVVVVVVDGGVFPP